MQINLYLSNIEKEIKDMEDIIDLCKTTNNLDKIKTLERLLEIMEYYFKCPRFIKERFIPELNKYNEYMGIIIFQSFDEDYYVVDILVNGLNKDIERKYGKIYDDFCIENDIEFINVNICDYDTYDFGVLDDYDCLKCL